LEIAIFAILSAAAIVTVACSVTRADPLVSALWFVWFELAVAGLMAMLGAPLIASSIVIVSAAAAVAVVVFVITLIDPRGRSRARQVKFGKIVAAVAAGYLAIVMTIAVAAPPFLGAPASGEYFESPATIGRIMLSRYAIPFEMVGIMLLIAAVSAVLIGRRGEG